MTDVARVIRKHAEAVLWTMIGELLEHHEHHVQLAIERAEGAGQREYGDSITRKPPTVLRLDRFEEHADAYVYGAYERENAHLE